MQITDKRLLLQVMGTRLIYMHWPSLVEFLIVISLIDRAFYDHSFSENRVLLVHMPLLDQKTTLPTVAIKI
jgi:hypothetical protein